MPYIDQTARSELGAGRRPRTAGELNFVISELVEDYIIETNDGQLSYSKLNEVLGVLTAAQLELYRRLAVPYEDRKIRENGDVFVLPEREFGDRFVVPAV